MIYFDNAATSRFKPKCVLKTAAYYTKYSSNAGRGSHKDALDAGMKIHHARNAVKSFVNANNAEVIFTKNCTEALNLALLGTAKLGGNVITTAFEHNSVLRPLKMLEREGLITVNVIQPVNGEILPEQIENAVNDKTYLVAVTAMSNVTGYTPPIAEIGAICRSKNLLFAVDGAQALGHTDVNFDDCGIDLLAGAGHKALHGPLGCGFLVCGKRAHVLPLMYGGTGTESAKLVQPATLPESAESGTLDLPAIAALGEAISWTGEHFKELKNYYKNISEYIENGIRCAKNVTIHSVYGSGIITFEIDGTDSGDIADELSEGYNIAVRAGLHCAPLVHKAMHTEKRGLVRISVGRCNSYKDADKLIKAVREIAANRL